MLNINKTIENGKAAFSLEGRLDTVTAPLLEAELKNALDGVNELTMDFEKLEYISSAGLRVLLAAHKEMNKWGTMKLTHVGETIMEIFEVTGFSDILTIA
jgi:anti-sigma B factor antagonist